MLWIGILDSLRAITAAEAIGAIFGLVSVIYSVRGSLWTWPTALISIAAYAWLFIQIKLYADVLLQAFYFVTSLMGWWYWVRGGERKTELPISGMSASQRGKALIVTVLAIGAMGWMFRSYTDAHLPYWDSAASGLSVTAQILLMRKKLENWIFWILADGLFCGIYAYKQVYLTSALYFIFLILAVQGLIEWRQSVQRSSSDALNPA